MRVAIVVPTLNEESTIAGTLPGAVAALGALEALAPREPRAAGSELVVADGGSRDRTVEVARALGVRVVAGPPGRGGQLNRGAAATTAEILIFLHADTTLPEGALGAIRAAIGGDAGGAGGARPVLGGAFLVRFDQGGPLLRPGAWPIHQRPPPPRPPPGDHGPFAPPAPLRP